MTDAPKLSVLVDTSFLITLYDKNRANHGDAVKYFKYFIDNSIKMYLSTIVISEFQQGQPIVDLINSGNYITLPFNYSDAIKSAEVAFNLGGSERRGTNPKYKDDIKLMGQAEANGINFIITEDESTLARYCNRLSTADVFHPKIIVLKKGFDVCVFNNGQQALIE